MVKIAWIHVDRLGCGSYRCWIPALSLEESKISSNNLLLQEDIQVLEDLEDLSKHDVVVFQRATSSLMLDMMIHLKSLGVKIVYELDDYLFDVPRHNPAAWFWNRKPIQKLLLKQLELVDAISVSTEPLAFQIQEMGIDISKIFVCFNHLHEAVWGTKTLNQRSSFKNSKLVIGWQGSSTHDVDFKEALPAIAKVLSERPDVVLRLFGDVPRSVRDSIPQDRFEWTGGVPFHLYPEMLKFINFDIGIAPCSLSKFNSCKSNIKWLEYSAIKVPCIASPINAYETSIESGKTGFVAHDTNDWYEYINQLLDNEELSLTVAQAAYDVVWETWSASSRIEPWERMIRALCPIQSRPLVV